MSFKFTILKPFNLNLSLMLNTPAGLCIFNTGTKSIPLEIGDHEGVLTIPGRLLNDDIYTIRLFFVKDTSTTVFRIDDILTFEVADEPRTVSWYGKWEGAVRPTLPFTLK